MQLHGSCSFVDPLESASLEKARDSTTASLLPQLLPHYALNKSSTRVNYLLQLPFS